MQTVDILLILGVVVFTAAAIVTDVRTMRLPNWLNVSALSAGLLFHVVAGAITGGLAGAGSGLLFSLGGFATGFGILLLVWMVGGGGGGDVKFMGALGAWLGWWQTLLVFVVGAMFAAFITIGVLAWSVTNKGVGGTKGRYLTKGSTKRRAGETAEEFDARRKQRRRLVAFAVPASLATWVILAFKFAFPSDAATANDGNSVRPTANVATAEVAATPKTRSE